MTMNETTRILCAISATEPCSFGEFLNGLGDDRPEWRQIFLTLESLEEQELCKVERAGGRIQALQLTPLGAERAREALRGADR
jgi:hypothetical protein